MAVPEFISESITPVPGSFKTDLMSIGLASMPSAFVWRDRRYEIVECLEHSKQSTPEGNPGGEQYLRRQQFVVRLDTGQIATIYVERQARAGSRSVTGKKRWFMYTIASGE